MEYNITVNWDGTRDLAEDLLRFRNAHPGVAFEPSPGWASGPGFRQWPEVRIASKSLSAFQAAIRMFAIGPGVLDGCTRLHEEWEFALVTGQLEKASFDWHNAGGEHCATDVLSAGPEEPEQEEPPHDDTPSLDPPWWAYP